MKSSVAISWLLLPAAIRFNTSTSRAESAAPPIARSARRSRCARGDERTAGMNLADRRQQVRSRAVLEQIPPGAVLESAENALVAVIGGQHQYAGVREFAANGDDGAGAVELRHGEILHEGHIRS